MALKLTKKLFFLFALLLSLRLFTAAEAETQDEDLEDDEDMGPIIGIDLGTTYSVVGIYNKGKVEIIANEQGSRITPSYVAFTKNETIVGEGAKNQYTENHENTIYAVKRLIGRTFTENSVTTDRKHLTYDVVNKDNKPHIRVKRHGKSQDFAPEEISALILGKLKTMAENYLGRPVKHAVITVPAHFKNAQRLATKQAGAIAGLNVIRIINEPTAASIAYGLNKKHAAQNASASAADGKNGKSAPKAKAASGAEKASGETHILVYDLGGGTFDVSLLALDGDVFEVKTTSGDTRLGGEDFDTLLARHLAEEFDPRVLADKAAFSRLKAEAERVKRQLSSQVKAEVSLDNLFEGRSLKTTVLRSQFERICRKLFDETLKHLRKVLADAKLRKQDIDEVVMVGGSTKIPKVQALVSEFFDGKRLHLDIDPDEAVAYGAAVQGYILSGASDEDTKDMLLLDVTPLSLGIETAGGVHSKVIKKSSPIPTSQAQTFTTNADEQTTVTISIFEGEARMVKHCHLLSHFDLSGIAKQPRGVPKIEVTFEIDANGILEVTAKDRESGKNKAVTVNQLTSGADNEELERMRTMFEDNKEEDERLFARATARNGLEGSLHAARALRKKSEESLKAEDLQDLDGMIEEVGEWLKQHEAAETEAAEFEEKKKEIDSFLKEMEGGEGEEGEGDEEGAEQEGEKEEL